MEIYIGSKIIKALAFSNTETAWKMEDADLVLRHFKNINKLVLGGDVLTKKLKHNYDSWYYNVDTAKDREFNVENSIKLATEYISKYTALNGNAFYVIFVTD